jgi:hypothetical protein
MVGPLRCKARIICKPDAGEQSERCSPADDIGNRLHFFNDFTLIVKLEIRAFMTAP